MARTNYDTVKPLIVADWRTGAYTIKELQIKHKVSAGFVHAQIKGVEQDTKNAVNKIVELKQELTGLDEYCVNAVNEVALNRIRFETQNNARMELAAQKAMDMLDGVDRVGDVKQVMDVLKIHREARLGKAPDTAIQINNGPRDIRTIELVALDDNSEH